MLPIAHYRNPVIVMTLNLEPDGSYQPMAAKLLAHEIAHLMGAWHDGEKVTQGTLNPYLYESKYYLILSSISMHHCLGIPCPNSNFLLSTVVVDHFNSWSECTKRQIDAEHERRNKAESNCLLT